MSGEGGNADRNTSNGTQSEGSTNQVNASAGTRPTAIQRGFLNKAARRGRQAAQQAGSAGMQVPSGSSAASPTTQPDGAKEPEDAIQAAAPATQVQDSTREAAPPAQAAPAPTASEQRVSSALGAAARSMWGGGARDQAAAQHKSYASATSSPASAAAAASSGRTQPTEAAPTSTPPSFADRSAVSQAWSQAFNTVAPGPSSSAREAFFTNHGPNLAARPVQQGRPARPQPTPQPNNLPFPREEVPTRAMMVPPDENALLELRAGSLLPTVHFKLPFSTADGKQIIIALPGDCIPCYARSEIGTNSDEGINFNFYDLYRLERPTDPQQRIAYVPFTPIYTPRHGGSDRPAILVDQHSGWVWPVVPYSDLATMTLPWINRRQSHYVAGPPFMTGPFDPSEIDENGCPGYMPGNRHYERRLREAQEAGPVPVETSASSLLPQSGPAPSSHDGEATATSGMAGGTASLASSSAVQTQQQTREGLNRNQPRRRGQHQPRDQQERLRAQEQPRQQERPHIHEPRPQQNQTLQQDHPLLRQYARPQGAAAQGPPLRPQRERQYLQPPPIGQLTRVHLMPDDGFADRELLNGVPIPTAHYTLPFTAPDGRQSIVAIPGDFVAWLSINALAAVDQEGFDIPEGLDRDEPIVPYVPNAPYYVPRGGTTEEHIPWLYDDVTGWAWPMLTLSNFQPGDLPWTNTRGAHWIAGPPLPADLFAEDDTTGPQWALPPAERLSARRKDAEEYPNRVKRFIDGFDTVDAELRLRMARLGIGQIGSDASGGAPGCVVCLEKFGEEDAEWLADTSTLDQQVVVAPCGGFHAFHRGCLIKTLESVHSWRSWACPMCRAKLRDEEGKKKEEEEEAAGVGRAARGRGGVVATAAGVVTAAMATAAAMMSSSRGKAKPPTVLRVAPTSLREEIRRREQERGYVCDYPACYPTYGELPPTPPADDKDSYARLSAQVDRRLITLKPCGHQVHRECLLLELSAEGRQTLADSAEEDEGASGDDDSSDSVGGTRSDVASAELDQPEQRSRHQPLPTVHEVGRWVKCCVDRKGAWAMIPVVKKGNSITGEEEGSAEVSSSSEQRRLDKGKGKAKA